MRPSELRLDHSCSLKLAEIVKTPLIPVNIIKTILRLRYLSYHLKDEIVIYFRCISTVVNVYRIIVNKTKKKMVLFLSHS